MTESKKGIFDGCLLLSDIDGTLVCRGEIPKRNLDAIAFFLENGGLFSIATGRSIEATRPYVRLSGANAGIVTFNGAVIYDYQAENTIISHQLPESAKQYLMPIIKAFPKVGAEVQYLRRHYIINNTEEIVHHMEYERIAAENVPLDAVFSQPWTKVLFASFDEAEMDRLHAYCEKLPVSDCYFLKTAEIYYELTCGGVNKGTALDALAGYYSIGREKVFAVGNYYNDAEMLAQAGISAVAAEAPEDLKSCADFIAGPCEQGCVADFIEYLSTRQCIR